MAVVASLVTKGTGWARWARAWLGARSCVWSRFWWWCCRCQIACVAGSIACYRVGEAARRRVHSVVEQTNATPSLAHRQCRRPRRCLQDSSGPGPGRTQTGWATPQGRVHGCSARAQATGVSCRCAEQTYLAAFESLKSTAQKIVHVLQPVWPLRQDGQRVPVRSRPLKGVFPPLCRQALLSSCGAR
jgi:hypothetical protein